MQTFKSTLCQSGAKLSECRTYRYALWRQWDDSIPSILFVGLNPSKADEKDDDPTLLKCIQYARKWGYGGVYMGNLFSFRATQPRDLFKADDPIGEENDSWLDYLNNKSKVTVAAWGNHGQFMDRSMKIKPKLNNLHYLKMNATGEPAHPLYLCKNLSPKKF